MRIISMFHTLVVLMAVLTFSTSFVTLAQQNPVLTEVSETAAAQNANAVVLEAKAAAEQDASKDTNELLWFCIGGTLPWALAYGFMGGYMIQNPSEFTGGLVIDFEEHEALACGVGLLALSASCIGIASWGIFAKTPPPPERLIGKSPEYVASYLNAYKRKVRTLRGTSTVGGSVAGCLSIFLLVRVAD